MIRALTEKDRDLWIEMTGEFYSSPAVDHQIPEKFRNNCFDALMSGTPYADAIIIECDGKCAGYALFAITFSQEAGGIAVWIEEAYIRAEFRGKGLGHEIFEWVESKYPNASRFRLEVEDDNLRAIRLYESLGYKRLNYGQMVKDL